MFPREQLPLSSQPQGVADVWGGGPQSGPRNTFLRQNWLFKASSRDGRGPQNGPLSMLPREHCFYQAESHKRCWVQFDLMWKSWIRAIRNLIKNIHIKITISFTNNLSESSWKESRKLHSHICVQTYQKFLFAQKTLKVHFCLVMMILNLV